MASTEASQIVVPDDGNGAVEQPNQDGAAQPQQQPQQTVWQTLKSVAFRIFVFYMIMNLFKRGTSPTTEPGKEGEAPANVKVGVNLFDKGTLLDMKVFISEEEFFSDFTNPDKLFWEYDNLEYGDWTSGPNGDGSVTYTDVIPATEAMMNNGSIYAHVYFTKVNYSPDPSKKGKYSKKYTFSITKQLNKFKKRKYLKTKNLLTGETDASPDLIKSAETEGPVQILSHWHPNLTIALVDDHTPFREGSVPQPLDKLMTFYNGDYYPIIFVNDYWNLNSDYMPINQTTPELTLELTFTPMSLMKLQFYAAQTMKNQWSTLLGEAGGQGDDEEEDGLKRAMLDTNPYLLGLTFVVSIVHSVFEFLAFKNDIQFWNNRKSLEGLSVRSVFFGVFQSLVVLLYIMDNDTNFVVKVGVFVGLLIDCWKITKVCTVKFDRNEMLFGFIPKLTFTDKESYTASATKEYDMQAFKYLSWLLYPLLGCYAVYALLYQEHKGWYSFVLNMLYGFLLTFGFIMMTPPLFVFILLYLYSQSLS
ncbi:putative lipid scramblase CLPTM1 isoform X2 [Apostichopus japonicus]|uniref:putative lipid scramblase CLPTM1 isoform X2 n=1 Tax=Stichopus japonicus TaxID=307972 RepID=UPI003AB72668